MRNSHVLGPWLERFLLEHVVTERNLARNTQKSYRDTFKLLVPFMCAKLRKGDDRLAVRDLTSESILNFLDHLEVDRGCSVKTRNQRLAAIRAFARFVGSRDPEHIGWSTQVRAISSKKAPHQAIQWLTKTEVNSLLAVPNRETLRGRIEYALLVFLYNTGARASEVAALRVGDVQIGDLSGRHHLVTLHGKGGKLRQCPLLQDTTRVLREFVNGRDPTDPVFLSRYRKPYTRFGVYRLVERCADAVPSLAGRKITPHVLRHTIACHLVASGVDINVIRAWLGHVDLKTTNVYAEIDPDTKARALALCDAVEPGTGRPWKEQSGLLAFLKSL